MNRRDILKHTALLGAIPLLAGLDKANMVVSETAGEAAAQQLPAKVTESMLAERRKARRRVRRIIMNNDGGDSLVNTDQPISRELYLARRMFGIIHSQVDSVFYCTGVTNFYTQRSNVTERQTTRGRSYLNAHLDSQGTDTLEAMVSFCKQYNKEVFWSMRMNDTHDSADSELLNKFKSDHPHLMMGSRDNPPLHLKNRWSALDYGFPEVRQMVINNIHDVVSRYNVDGIELDFFRHPHFFRGQFYNKEVTQADCNKMTEMVRKIRAVCDREALRRKRPVLVSIRVPDSLEFSKAIGLDWEQWLREELIDIVTGADYLKFEPWAQLVTIGNKYNVPVYAGIEQRRMIPGNKFTNAEEKSFAELWRGEAYSAWLAGMNGIYTFNRFNPHDSLFNELGDPTLLEGLPRREGESFTTSKSRGMFSPEYWLKGGNRFLQNPVL